MHDSSPLQHTGEVEEKKPRDWTDRVKPAHKLPLHREKKWQQQFELPEVKLLPMTFSGSVQVLLRSAVQGREQAEEP